MKKTTMMAKVPTHIITPEKGEISSVLGKPVMNNNRFIILIIIELDFLILFRKKDFISPLLMSLQNFRFIVS